jgi:hypothetical protein
VEVGRRRELRDRHHISAAAVSACRRRATFCLFLDLQASSEHSGQKLLMATNFLPMLIGGVSSGAMTLALIAVLQEPGDERN